MEDGEKTVFKIKMSYIFSSWLNGYFQVSVIIFEDQS